MQPVDIETLPLATLVKYLAECQGSDTITFATEEQYLAHLRQNFGK